MAKIHITLSEPCRPNYLWASPQNSEWKGDYLGFDNQFSTGELEHIYAPEMIDCLHSKIKMQALHNWTQLLGVDGIIDIGGTDPYILCRKIASRQFHYNVLNDLKVKNFTPINELRAFLIERNFKINHIHLDESTAKYVITAQKCVDSNSLS